MSEGPFAGVAVADRPGRWVVLLLIALALSAWVYAPILRVKLFADDFAHMISVESNGVADFLLAPFGGHNLFARNLVYWATWKLFGLRDGLYAATSLATHLLNVALCFAVIRRLLGSAALACFGAALWGTSPLCLGTLGWYSVHGHALVATVLLVVLLRVVELARRHAMPGRVESAVWYVLLLLGTTCFGVGVGVALVFPFVLFLLLPETWRPARTRLRWLSLPVVTLALYFGFRRFYAFVGPITFAETLQEVMARDGLYAMPTMLAHLLAFSVTGSMLGFFMPSVYPSTASWAALGVFGCALLVVIVRGGPAVVRHAVAMAALAVGAYMVIAIGRGHTYVVFKVDTAVAAKMARYHYVGSLPIAMLLCVMLDHMARLPGLRAIPAPLALAAGLAAIVSGHYMVGLKVVDYRWTKTWVRDTAASIVTDVQAWPPHATAYLENGKTPLTILGPAMPASAIPGRAGIFVLLHRSDEVDGRTVRFIERDPDVLADVNLRPTSRLARLIVAPSQVPAHP